MPQAKLWPHEEYLHEMPLTRKQCARAATPAAACSSDISTCTPQSAEAPALAGPRYQSVPAQLLPMYTCLDATPLTIRQQPTTATTSPSAAAWRQHPSYNAADMSTTRHPSCRTCLKASPCWCCAHHLHQDRCCHRRPDLLLLLPAAASACKPCRCTSTRRYYLPMPPSSPPWPSRRCCCCSCWRCCFTACPRTRTGARARP